MFTRISCLKHFIDITDIEAKKIQQCETEINKAVNTLLLIGAGGSFLGARAVIDALTPNFSTKNNMEIIYAGNNMSGAYLQQLLDYLDSKEL